MRFLWLLACLLIAVTVSAQGTKQITLEDIYKSGTFKVKGVPGFNAMKDGKRYTQLDAEGGKQVIAVYNLSNGKKEEVLFDNSIHKHADKVLHIDEYAFSDDESKLLLLTESEHIYRRSVLHKVYVYDIKYKTVALVDYEKVLHASFSPDASKVAYVKDNNLYYKDLARNSSIPVTTDGKKNSIINGNCDWVYEEEFEFTKAYQWSKNGKHIAYYRFDESKVPQYTMVKFDSLYPTQYVYKYPKAGEPNSVVQIKIYNMATQKTVTADVGNEKDQYIPRIKWTEDPNLLCIFRLNRLQNKLDLLRAEASNGNTQVIYSEENKYYVEINDNLEFLPDGHSFIFNSEKDGYNRLYKWDWQNKKLTPLTEGKFDVDQLLGVDKQRDLVYYTAAEPTPMERMLYVVSFDGSKRKKLTEERGTHAITPCSGYNYFLDRYSTLKNPPVTYLRDANGTIVRMLEDNAELKAKMAEYQLGKVSMTIVPSSDGTDLNAYMITPPGFDPEKKYPLLMFQYSGPGSQQVADKFPLQYYFWHQMLAQKGYVILCADGTGTGYRGEEFKKKTYLQLGKLESNDQIAIAKHMNRLPFIDKDRIGIWGWSYGGFTSALTMLKADDVFKVCIAVAPVTNWRFYDNIYTERYMRTPQENKAGYDDNAPEKLAGNLKGKLMLIHGTGDDNVHVQNSIMLSEALIQANKKFDSEYYPNKAHGISGGNTTYHLFTRLTDFILANL